MVDSASHPCALLKTVAQDPDGPGFSVIHGQFRNGAVQRPKTDDRGRRAYGLPDYRLGKYPVWDPIDTLTVNADSVDLLI